jgi:uncharacterized membrane protein
MSLLEFIFRSFWHFIGSSILLSLFIALIANLWNNTLRTITNIKRLNNEKNTKN